MFKSIKEKLLKKKLSNIDPDTVPRFSFNGIKTYARICSVYDGDTVTIVFEHFGQMIKYSARIYGIDTPEIRTHDPIEKSLAYEARDFLSSYILDQVLYVELLNFDKYGRLLINIYMPYQEDMINIADLMLINNYAKPYFGGTK